MSPTIVKDSATAQSAALNLDKGSEPMAPMSGEPTPPRTKSTSEVLFPEFTTDDGGIINRPVRPFEDKGKPVPSGAATPAQAPAPATPAAPAPTPGSILDLSKLPPNTMVRMKVDGVEMDVPAEVAVKNLQLERHLNLKSQRLEAERAAWEEERRKQQTPALVTNTPPAPSAEPGKAPPAGAEAARIASLEAQLAAVQAQIAPQVFQEGLKRLDTYVRGQLGADDFMTYAPKIREFVDGEMAKPEVRNNAAAVQQLDSQAFWYGKYQEMKLKDMMAGRAPSPAPAPHPVNPVVAPVVIPPGTTAVLDRNGNVVPIPVIESSTGVPSRTTPEADWQTRYQTAFAKAKETGKNEDWQDVFRIKRETGPT